MQRTFTALLVVGLALASVGCAPRRYYYDYDHDHRRSDRWDRDDDDYHRSRLNLNSASARELDRLPGLSEKDAQRIVANRPYDDKHDLLDRRVIRPRTYDQIEDYVYAGRSRDRRDYDRHHDRHDYDRSRPYSRDDNRYQERRFYDDR